MRWLLIACMVLSSIPAYALDKYDDDLSSKTGWTDNLTNGTVTATTFEGSSVFECKVTTGASGNFALVYRVTPVTGANVSLTFSVDPDNEGTLASTNTGYIAYYDGAYYSAFRIASDGFFALNSTNNYSEVGTDAVTVGTKDTWTVKIKGSGTAKTITVYRGSTYIGSMSNAAYANTTYGAGVVRFGQTSNSLNNAISYWDSISVSSYGLQYFENCDSITDWTDADAGTTSVSTQETLDSMSTFQFLVPTAGASRRAMRYYDLPTSMPKRYIVETKIKHVSLGTNPADGFCVGFPSPSTTKVRAMYFGSDGFFFYTVGYNELGTNIVDTGVWTTWRVFVDDSANANAATAYVWKNGVYQGSASCGYAGTGFTVGRIYIFQYGTTLNGAQSNMDYLRFFSEDGQLIQTVIE